MRAMLSGDVDGLHIRLGLPAFRIGRPRRLRFCHECLRSMYSSYGELYWRRDHQVPSLLLCPENGNLLSDSELHFSQFSRHQFVAASEDNCPITACVSMVSESQGRAHLLRLARASARVLKVPPQSRSFSEWTEYYRSQMERAGLTSSHSRMKQSLLAAEFRAFYGETLELIPKMLDGQEFAGNWLAGMVRKHHRKANHPTYHLLMEDFLEQRGQILSPFGAGPWPCPNPLASHDSPLPVVK
jgi:hypothetical protein